MILIRTVYLLHLTPAETGAAETDDGGPAGLTYEWTLIGFPAGSAAAMAFRE